MSSASASLDVNNNKWRIVPSGCAIAIYVAIAHLDPVHNSVMQTRANMGSMHVVRSKMGQCRDHLLAHARKSSQEKCIRIEYTITQPQHAQGTRIPVALGYTGKRNNMEVAKPHIVTQPQIHPHHKHPYSSGTSVHVDRTNMQTTQPQVRPSLQHGNNNNLQHLHAPFTEFVHNVQLVTTETRTSQRSCQYPHGHNIVVRDGISTTFRPTPKGGAIASIAFHL